MQTGGGAGGRGRCADVLWSSQAKLPTGPSLLAAQRNPSQWTGSRGELQPRGLSFAVQLADGKPMVGSSRNSDSA
jgi:hypothetical protein